MLCVRLKVHVDGARIMNAAVAVGTQRLFPAVCGECVACVCVQLGVSVADLCKHADSVSACLSKGLGSPTGAVVVGSKDFIHRCRRLRKALGGGMRQAGVSRDSDTDTQRAWLIVRVFLV